MNGRKGKEERMNDREDKDNGGKEGRIEGRKKVRGVVVGMTKGKKERMDAREDSKIVEQRNTVSQFGKDLRMEERTRNEAWQAE